MMTPHPSLQFVLGKSSSFFCIFYEVRNSQEIDTILCTIHRMILSCSYTVEVKVCASGGNSTFYWEIVEGTSTNMKDLMSCIVLFHSAQRTKYYLSPLTALLENLFLCQVMKNA
jgi:hypothetical protein